MALSMVVAEVAMKRPARPDYKKLWTTVVALAVSVTLMFPFMRAQESPAPASYAIPLSMRDNWHRDAPPVQLRISGLATWYNAKNNNAWYTRTSEWGNKVVYYAAAGPALRKFIEQQLGKDIRWGVSTWTKMAQKGVRPKFLLTAKSTGKSVIIVVTDWCGCQGRASDDNDTRLVDLAPEVWGALGVDLGLGVMKVKIELIKE